MSDRDAPVGSIRDRRESIQSNTGADGQDIKALEQLRSAYSHITEQIGRRVVGQNEVVEQLLIALFAGGHVLLVGVPGLAKTLLVRTLAQSLSLRFDRIQFTPDLMPSDITGIEVFHEDRSTGDRELRFHPGPIFAQVILADEINRTPPKTQAALLEAMQEMQVTVGGRKHAMEPPFFVLATQNPIEQEGTYPLPEALLDRFMFQVQIDYPDEEEELAIIRRTTSDWDQTIQSILTGPQILELMKLVRRIPVPDHVARHALKLVRATRVGAASRGQAISDFGREKPTDPYQLVQAYVSWGAGPRASQYLVLGAKSRAALHGRFAPSTEDVDAVAHCVLRHRVRTNYAAAAEGLTPDEIITRIVKWVGQQRSAEERQAERLLR